jgi:hypothetical protein
VLKAVVEATTAVVETNFELNLKAKDQCGVKDQGGAVAKWL